MVTSTWVFDTDEEGRGTVSEYVGGYQEYLVQKNRSDAANAAKSNSNTQNKVTKTAPAAKKPTNAAKKLNYNEQRELDNLPKEIAALEAEQAELNNKLADGSWFIKDFDAATVASERLAVIEDEMMHKLERWDALDG